MLKAIHAQENLKAAREKAEAAIAEPRRRKMTRPAKPVEERIAETLTHYAFPDSHWIKIRTDNPLERIMKEIRRRAQGPSEHSPMASPARTWRPRGSGTAPAASGQRGSTGT